MVDSETHSRELDGSSPDLLKNTPFNIARLEDVIEHCEGRHKYLAQTRSPSDGSNVRWYFSKASLAENELAASVPRKEIVGKSEYFRFGMRDSLAIEASFLQREEELLPLWWKEYAESSEGPKQLTNSGKELSKQSDAPSDGCESTRWYEIEEERVGVPVKGGLYEVDLVRRHCFPVYWSGDDRRVLRGHWFARKGSLDWLPIREDVAEQLEVAYHNKVWRRRRFQLSGLFAARVDLQGSSPGLHALFTGEDDTWEAWLNADPSGFSGIVGYSAYGFKLRRGYSGSQTSKPSKEELRQRKEEDMDDYCSQVPVRHLVFMVHGIGQRLEKSNFVDDVGNFHQITASLAERHLTSYQRGTQRVLFIPCQWRKGLKLSGEAAVEKCTLAGVRGLRLMLSATSHDILYYMSPIYCQDIIDSVSNQLNRLYLKFKKRNPGYDGKVSIYGHSLGSVLSYDILCHQENLSSPFPIDSIHRESSTNDGSFPQRSAESSMSESSTDVEPTKSDRMDGTFKFFTQADEDLATSEPAAPEHMEATAEDSSSVSSVSTVCGVNMDFEAICGKTDQYTHTNDSNDEQTVVDSLGEAKRENQALPCSDEETKAEENSKNGRDEDEKIKSLRKEIDALKAKLVQLESQTGNRDSDDTQFPEKANELESEKQLVSKSPSSLSEEEDGGALKNYTPCIKYTKLEFKVDTFFAVGSPLGVFLALRNIRLGVGKGKDYWMEETVVEEMPACRRIFNIFHPFDPVAYRIEPLICKEYINKQPVIVPYHKGGRRLHIGFQEFTEDLSARSQVIINHFDAVRIRVLTVCQSRSKDELEEEGSGTVDEKEEKSYGSLMMERLTGSKDGRIDHVLQDKTFEHPYLQAIGSHTNYWRDYDTALFILKHLYRDISEDHVSFEDSNEADVKSTSPRSDTTESDGEETPLTFSDKSMVRSFSAKAKKFLNKT